MKITKWHFTRIVLTSVFTIMVLKLASVMQILYNYIIARWLLDTIEYDLGFMDFNLMQILVTTWNYFIAFFIIICIWKWIALPQKVYHGLLGGLKSFMFPKYGWKEDE